MRAIIAIPPNGRRPWETGAALRISSCMFGTFQRLTLAVNCKKCLIGKMNRTILSLQAAMSHRNWSMTDLAAAADLDASMVSRLFRGRFPSAKTIRRILGAFRKTEQREIVVAWLTDLAEIAGVDPTNLVIRTGNG